MRRPLTYVIAFGLAASLVAAVAAYRIDGSNWRARLVLHKARGALPGVAWTELLPMLLPGSGFYLRELADNPNPYAVISAPHTAPDDLAEGQRLFEQQCMSCHGAGGIGGSAPNIANERLSRGDSDWAIYQTLKEGVAGTAMAAPDLTVDERWRVTAYLKSLRWARHAAAGPAVDDRPHSSAPYERIVAAATEPHNWMTYSREYDGQRHTPLTGINKATLGRLRLRWVVQTDAADVIEASPIVVDGVMYVSLPGGTVMALDAGTGATIWRTSTRLDPDLPVCCGHVNRGVAILNDRIYATTLDDRLQSLDAATGEIIWERRVADSSKGYTITVAPLALQGIVIVGVSGGEYGIRGFLDAYDAVSGEQAWRFWTVPEPGQPGSETWADDDWRLGGGPTWVTGSFDPMLNLLYWGVGNPAPDFDASARPGDNLYTNSVVALDVKTGKRAWHFQFTPHDLHDFDSNQVPVLADRLLDGVQRRLMFWANSNGFFYVLDRTSGEYLGSVPFAKQTWALGIDDEGRPVPAPAAAPSTEGALVWPGASGATNWPPPSFNPTTGLMYVGRTNRPSVFFTSEEPESYRPGQKWLGGSSTRIPGGREKAMVAIDPLNLELVWETPLPDYDAQDRFAGVLTTRDLVIVGVSGALFAIDAVDGELLWETRLGGIVGSPPISYAIDGVQYLTTSAGPNIFTFGVNIESGN